MKSAIKIFMATKRKKDATPRRPDKKPKPKPKKAVPEKYRCKARLKSNPNKRCTKKALEGRNYCYKHQGASPVRNGIDNAYYVGNYAELVGHLDIPIFEHEKDLSNELQILRVQMMALIEKAQTIEEAGPTLLTYVEAISKVAKRMDQIENGLKLSLNPRQVAAIANQIVDIINEEVDDPQIKANISNRIANVIIPGPY